MLRGSAHFSLEQAEAINEWLGHTDEQGRFLLLLVQKARAGTPKLRARFDAEIEGVREGRKALKNRFGIGQPLSRENQFTYFNSWQYGAVHALASIPRFQSASSIARRLALDVKRVSEILDFLVQARILTEQAQGYGVGIARMHLGSDSSLIAKHHINWRVQAIRALEAAARDDLHYSSVVSVSREDGARIREILTQALEKIRPIIRESKEEEAMCLAFDWFEI